jgi:hypothetical protein
MWRIVKSQLEQARKMRSAELNDGAEISDEEPLCDMTVDVVAQFASLPCQQARPLILDLLRQLEMYLLSQQ